MPTFAQCIEVKTHSSHRNTLILSNSSRARVGSSSLHFLSKQAFICEYEPSHANPWSIDGASKSLQRFETPAPQTDEQSSHWVQLFHMHGACLDGFASSPSFPRGPGRPGEPFLPRSP